MKTILTVLMMSTAPCMAGCTNTSDERKNTGSQSTQINEMIYKNFNLTTIDFSKNHSTARNYICNEDGFIEAELYVSSGTIKLQAFYDFPDYSQEDDLPKQRTMEIKLFSNAPGTPFQTIRTLAVIPEILIADTNFDGDDDIVLSFDCGTSNGDYRIFIYDKVIGKFSLAADLWNPTFIAETETVQESIHISAFDSEYNFYRWKSGKLTQVANAFVSRRGIYELSATNEYLSLELTTIENDAKVKYKATIPGDFSSLTPQEKTSCFQNYFYVLGRFLSYTDYIN